MSSQGHVFALAAVLAVLVANPAAVGGVILATTAVLLRWGTPSLDAVAGAQSVLGPGGLVGPQAAAASAWFAAAALLLATPRPAGDPDAVPDDGARRRRPPGGSLVASLALGAAAAAAVAGPEFGDGGVLRAVATVVAAIAGLVVASLRLPQVTATLALVAGLVAAALAASVASGRVGL